MEEPVWKGHGLHLVEREPRPVIDVSYVELPEKLTYRIDASFILGTIAVIAMIAATGTAEGNPLLSLICPPKKTAKKDRLRTGQSMEPIKRLKKHLCTHYTGAGRRMQVENDGMKEIFRDFDALAIKGKLDAAISLAGQYNANAASGTVKFVPVDRIRIDDRIDLAASAVGAELKQFEAPSGGILYYFGYKGWEVSQLNGNKN